MKVLLIMTDRAGTMTRKKCAKCGEAKLLGSFCRDRKEKDGRFYQCRACQAAHDHDYYIEHRIDRNAQTCAYYKENADEINAKKRDKHKANPEKQNKRGKIYHDKYPERAKAVHAVGHAIKMGRLIRPGRCERCNKACKPAAHHWNYAKEYWLDVEWLCGSCHGRHHQEKRVA